MIITRILKLINENNLFLNGCKENNNEFVLIDKEYLLDEYEFEPWVANTIEEFCKLGLTVDEYKKKIENNGLFIDKINKFKLSKFINKFYSQLLKTCL